jgi:uncharacterized protein
LKRELSFIAGCSFEGLLLMLALLWGQWFHRVPLADLHWKSTSVLIGIGAAVPPFVFLVWTLKSRLTLLSRHRQLMDSLLRPLLEQWSVLQLLAISVLAGVSEEAFFRGAIQGGLADRVNWAVALILASSLFGACHLLSWTYGIIAALLGAYLGLLWIWTGNLLTPIITHAVYDFAALVYLLRIYRAP